MYLLTRVFPVPAFALIKVFLYITILLNNNYLYETSKNIFSLFCGCHDDAFVQTNI